ncbi:stress response protein ElaB [Enterobacter roggenkampii]|uniref:stress response protein ElaB n=1 Tax=Enterobacter roggenkampii TaxID=1812935 RepID=UPI0020043296|nr:stress response protein ElaB [Enterobacter roggenkampii]MCK7073938.1 stress response protein ElaB [Enterobacter roggenkampii]HCM9502133.1 stress response protein ElaB [Enterobacter roggenkampii]
MSFQSWDTRIDDDLALLSETLEDVLRSSGDPADQKYIELKARAEQALHEVKNRVSHASDTYYYRAKKAVYRADDYVHEKPWQGIGVGAALGLVLGLLLARR